MRVRLTVRAGGDVVSWTVDEWSVLTALAAVSAEPESMAEFFAALRRYQPNHCWDETGQVTEIDQALRGKGASCLIDLDSCSILGGGAFELPERGGAYEADEDERGDGFHIVWLDIPEDWLFEDAGDDWTSLLTERAEANQSRQRIDTRAVLFGRPMLEFIASRVLDVAAHDADDEQRYEQIRAIHADWLMSARDDLQGRTPRQVLLRGQHHIGMDIQHRSQQWTMQGFGPPPLDADSAAYRFGGYGTTEIVLYFDLMRSLLGRAWDWSVAGEARHDVLVERLADHRDECLNHPPEDSSSGLTCHELIESERRRMPVTGDGSHLDCDCPICQATADGAFGMGPMFMFFDGHHLELEDEFAFSMTESREDWEREQEEFRRFNEEMDRETAVREAAGEEEADSVWRSSYVDWDNVIGSGDSPTSAKTALAFPLSELVTELQAQELGRPHIDALNAAFSAFRRAEDYVAEQSAAEELRTRLEKIADIFPDLTPRSADLQSRLDEVLRASSSRGEAS